MSSVGRMDGAFFVSRSELLSWVNNTFDLGVAKVEQCANGAVYCQVIDACHPGAVMMKKVNWLARAEHEAIPNYKVLQQAFDKCGIPKHVEVDKLIRGKNQDNLEMLQWIKTYFDRTYTGNEYDAAVRRFGELPEWAIPKDGAARNREVRSASPRPAPRPQEQRPATGDPPPRSGRESRPSLGGRPGGGRMVNSLEHEKLREEYEKLREEIVDLKITVDGLETERDFYFQKLRDIEILCQALEATPDPNITVGKFVEDVQCILYAKDDDEEGEAGG